MRTSCFLFTLLLIYPSILISQTKQLPDKALCIVCALKGEIEPEKVKAQTEYQGNTYHFCSENCKTEFDSDPVGYLPPQLPRPAPPFIIETLDGRDISLKDFADKVVLLDFWATWCKPCLKAMPRIQELYDSYSDKGLVVLGISIDKDKDRIKKINRITNKLKISYPIFWDGKTTPAWHIFKVKAIPAMFLIDKKGQIVAQWTGKIEHEQVVDDVAHLIARTEENENR